MNNKNIKKTNAARVLDKLNINYELVEYNISLDDLSAEGAAKAIGADPDAVFKTLVLKGDKTGIIVACLAALQELSLKKSASVSGNRSVELVNVKELQNLTGYVRGGCSPIGMKKDYPVFIDETCSLFDTIYINAGSRGVLFRLSPDVLITACKAGVYDISR